jgi:hypothetical protein
MTILALFILSLWSAGTAKAQNQTVVENAKAGTTAWQITDPTQNREIEGYASLTSVNRGGSIQFFVNTVASTFSINIYRMGWYNGTGGRLVAGPITLTGKQQTMPTPDPQTGLIECNWTSSYTLNIPTPSADPTNNWCSGVYIAQLNAHSSNQVVDGDQADIIFVVRDDSRTSDILFQSAVTTYEAYNTWGGKSLYDFNSTGGRAAKVSFNRPYYVTLEQNTAMGAGDFLLGSDGGPLGGWEYCMVRYLERQGYDVTYCTNVDTHENANLLLTHNTFLSIGHDEYWSWQMRSNVQAALNQGVKLGFLGANDCYWEIRFETSLLTGASDRTVVCYKGTPDSTVSAGTLDPYYSDSDPTNDYLITVRWRDTLTNSTRVALPEEQLIGTMYDYGADSIMGDIVVTNPSNWLFANTGLSSGSHLTNLLGYEVDRMQRAGPTGAIQLAHSPYTGNDSSTDGNGNTNGVSDMTVYTASSGATVFATGSIDWAWGLDDWEVSNGYRNSVLNSAVQQITQNFLARPRGVPVVNTGGPYIGTANTALAFNGSQTVDPISGGGISNYAWNFGDGNTGTGAQPSHTYTTAGLYTVTLTATNVRGGTNTATTTASVGVPLTIWSASATPYVASANDPNALEVGVKFTSDIAGYVTGVRFYKSGTNLGTHVGSLWSNTGQLLAQATFTGESASGWQQVNFSQPVAIAANTTYVVSYHTSTGGYAVDINYFTFEPFDNAPLHALQSVTNNLNGVFLYGSGGFPNQSYLDGNYWVDVVFTPNTTSDSLPIVTAISPASGATGVSTSTNVSATFNKAMDPTTLTSSTFTLQGPNNTSVAATISYNAGSFTATLQPSSALAASTTYTATLQGGAIRDTSGNALASSDTWSFTTAAPAGSSITAWPATTTPAVADENDSNAVELGVKFRCDVAGYITSVRFYKGSTNTGTHIGSLWSSTGQLLAQATFTGETASGWQQVNFSQPVAIAANTVYVASYHTNTGNYADTPGYFANSGVDNPPLHLLQNGVSGGNGVYLYGSGGFPNQTYNSTNYWVDVVFSTTAPPDTPPTVAAVTPASGATGVSPSTAVTVTFSEAMDPATITTSTILLQDPSHNTVAATVTYNASTYTATLQPSSALVANTTYTATVLGGTTGSVVKDLADNPMATNYSWSFTTGTTNTTNITIWPSTATPASIATNDSNAVELGVKFRSDIAGYITSVRFYKGTGNTGTHVGSLWSSTGQLLAQATFTGETASGWQQVNFSMPVQIAANTVYVASYHTNTGNYGTSGGYFATSGYDNAPLHALQDGVSGGDGVYLYGTGGFPTQTYGSTNYWVDVVFSTTVPPDTTPPTIVTVTPASGATGVSTATTVTVTFSEAVAPSTISTSTIQLQDPNHNTVAATVTYNASTFTATLQPSSALVANTTYTATVKGGTTGSVVKDLAGNALAASSTWSFTTAAANAPMTIWPSTATPAGIATSDKSAVEVGVQFRSDVAGYITSVRFYKGTGNTGTHVGSLWSSTGQLLAQATFTGETASGWQQVNFSTPVQITANTVYVASYHTTKGNYADSPGYFATSGYDNAPLHALQDGVSGGDGVYLYGTGGFPNQTYGSTNYWVDVVFKTSL